MEQLSSTELKNLVKSVFPPFQEDKRLAVIVDIPNTDSEDNKNWAVRRDLAYDWFLKLKDSASDLGLEDVHLIAYQSVMNNNADLPETACIVKDQLPSLSTQLENSGDIITFRSLFETHQLFMAPTENSTTAPLKNAARIHGFRGATMPGFSPKMIPALRIDFNEVSRRVGLIKEKVDKAETARVDFYVEGHSVCQMIFDLRFRKGHLSSGQLSVKGTAGNAPSGETYIVPYEGERDGIPSKTRGTLPVQEGEALLFFKIEENQAVRVVGEPGKPDHDILIKEKDHLKREPAYGNMAELGFGVLSDFGLSPIGEILLDEKLGFHVAFGRSEHFGGITGPAQFSGPDEVIHLDRIYIPGCQPKIKVKLLQLEYPDGSYEDIMADGTYLVF